MRNVFLQDLFSNFLLAMVVMAVIAMRTQTSTPTKNETPTPCQPQGTTTSMAQLTDMEAVVSLAALASTSRKHRDHPVVQAVLPVGGADTFPNVVLPASVTVIAQGCVLGTFTCPVTHPRLVAGARRLEQLVEGCVWSAGAGR